MKKKRWLFGTFIVATICMFIIYEHEYNAAFFSVKEGVFYIQKISFSFFMIVQLKKNRSSRVVDILANYSFGLYFLHTLVSQYTLWYLMKFINDNLASFSFILSFLIALVYILFTIIQCWLLKKMFGKYTRNIIGV